MCGWTRKPSALGIGGGMIMKLERGSKEREKQKRQCIEVTKLAKTIVKKVAATAQEVHWKTFREHMDSENGQKERFKIAK